MIKGEYKPTNRIKSKSSKKTMFWCSNCDACHNSQYGICKNCGHIENRNKLKKFNHTD